MATRSVLFSSSFLLILLSFSLEKSNALEGRKTIESNFHTIQLTSILPSSSCKPSSKGKRGGASLEVINKHGPCSQLNKKGEKGPTLTEMLAHDQARVDSIQTRIAAQNFNLFRKTEKTSKKYRAKDSKTTLPAQPGIALSTGNYIVNVGIGTPKKDLTLIFDTGSDLTWTQCEPCFKTCFPQQQPIFNPSSSSTYSNISCSSTDCSGLKSATGNSPVCSSSTCVYGIQYGDSSFSIGFFAKDRLTLSATDVFDGFMFGCGQDNKGLFGKTAGLIGLGRDPLSIVSQTSAKFGKYFSYCLPTRRGSNGHLSFGKNGAKSNLQFTLFLPILSTANFCNFSPALQNSPNSPICIEAHGSEFGLRSSNSFRRFFKIFGMAPAKKVRSLSKRQSLTTDISPSKDGNGDNAKKSLQRKKKLSDMLGPQWSEEDLTRFYQAYRKYGKDWKKVSSAVKFRSAEMVEALYTMNRAYLSLPEGTASVAGLIAMMTDHYCNLAASDSEQESNEDAGTSRKFQNRSRVKVLPDTSKASEMTSSALAASHGCLTLLKKKRSGGSRPRAVGKRTPRFPVSFSYENPKGEKYFSPSRQSLKLQADDSDDDVKIALVLTEASQRGGSPQVSKTPNRRTDGAMTSPIGTAERKRVKMDMGNVKLLSNEVDGEEGSMEADTGELMRYKNELGESGTVGRTTQKRKRPYGRKLEVDDSGDNHFDDIREACSGTEEGQKLGAARGQLEMEATNEKNSKKRSKKVLFGRDESSAFDALQTLADLSLMMPTAENEDESMIQVKDEIDDHVDESGSLEAIPAHRQRDKRGSMGVKSRWSQPLSKFEVASSTVSKHGRVTPTDANTGPEAKQARKAQKAMSSKARKAEGHLNYDVTESQEAAAKEASKKSTNKGKRSYQVSPKFIKDQEHSSCADPRTERSDSAQSTAQIPEENQVNLPTKVRSRRKMDLKKPQRQKDSKMSDKGLDDTSASFPALCDKAFSLKKKISSCLSNHQVRRWCTYEWFYSAIDYPWFAKREFVEYLYHVGLGHVPRLTRVEWGVIRSSLGKPRRFSEQFLNEEKEKLNQYRESVRSHYTELREGTREGLPTDLARPLSVGQRVIAIHPKTREIHDGNVLTVDHSRCRVQFDRPELGVEFVMDIDCMPLNPFENMPTLLTRHADAVDKFFESSNELKINARANEFMQFPAGDSQENGDISSHFSPPNHPISNLLKQTKVVSAEDDMQSKSGVMETTAFQQIAYSKPSAVALIQAKEADVQALAELTRALDKKDAVVSELRRMNDDVLENQKSGDCSLKDSEPFKKQYAAVLIQLNEVNEQVSSALFRLRQRNTYHGSIPLAWPRPVPNFADPSIASTFDRCTNQPQESGFLVNEIIENSKIKSRTMVDAAVQAMLSFTGRDNTTEKIEEAIDYVNDRILLDDSCVPTPPDLKSKNMSDRNEAEIPSELITKCVSTLLMIQKCTERQFPPADVAKVLDSAVASLQPCCSQNFPLYAEIQKCMRIIKNQILALVPT